MQGFFMIQNEITNQTSTSIHKQLLKTNFYSLARNFHEKLIIANISHYEPILYCLSYLILS